MPTLRVVERLNQILVFGRSTLQVIDKLLSLKDKGYVAVTRAKKVPRITHERKCLHLARPHQVRIEAKTHRLVFRPFGYPLTIFKEPLDIEIKIMRSSSSAKDKEGKLKAKRKEYLKKSDPATVEELLGGKTLEKDYFKEGEWKPSWAHLEFVSTPNRKHTKALE